MCFFFQENTSGGGRRVNAWLYSAISAWGKTSLIKSGCVPGNESYQMDNVME